MSTSRAVRAFPVAADPWPVVDRWAGSQGYRIIEQDARHRVYKKGSGFWVAARQVEITAADGGMQVQAYVAANTLARAMALFLIPSEITVESGGVKAVIPRNLGRGEVNALMRDLGQPPIE
jgi:hypothetical protein